MKALVIAETVDAQRYLCAGARTLADEVVLAVVKGTPETGIADKAYDIELPAGEPVENAIAGLEAVYDAEQPDIVLIDPTPRCNILGGLLAAKNGTSVIPNVTSFDGDVVTNMYFGGLANMKQSATDKKFYSVAATAFPAADPTGTDVVETIAYSAPENALVLRETKEIPQEGADLSKLDVVVGVGRGFAQEEDLQLARDFAAKIGSDLGCSRPIAENVNWMPRSLYIGVSGLNLAPKAYFAIGISGQMQHMVGVSNADTIIAINKDANAPIFKQADYGIVADLYKVLPVLIEKF